MEDIPTQKKTIRVLISHYSAGPFVEIIFKMNTSVCPLFRVVSYTEL